MCRLPRRAQTAKRRYPHGARRKRHEKERGIRKQAGLLAVAGLLAAGSPARAVRDPNLTPASGAHWKAHAGLPDATGNADQALVYSVNNPNTRLTGGHVAVAKITGFEDMALQDLGSVGFAVGGDRAIILPCTRIAYETLEGRSAELMIHLEDMQKVDVDRSGFETYAYDGPFPQGTIDSVTVEVSIDNPHLVEDPTLRLDNLGVGGHLWTSAADNG